ncbi:Sterol 3-beta-glucosyltransferase UGT80A2 [Phytophthora citrophthora]|uniref:Sterol 3-beta-glucosyltransferase UGT80A2 n=1 Tax=Phytophthora citrophthora TaxID=4793 RepID=A0AAD9GQ30_9STRA|nr:Sterol 3-beta-glucosyltransferase UGT80A2 [Phytophthora citrophthora]
MTLGRAFRADAVIAHPTLLGQNIVAERLGILLHCMGDTPLTRTQAFGHVLKSSTGLNSPYHYAPANETSYGVLDKLVWESARDILDDFRYSLGLMGRSGSSNLLAEWRVPHTYLWSSALLDWRGEITIAGAIELEDDGAEGPDFTDIERNIRVFAERNRMSISLWRVISGIPAAFKRSSGSLRRLHILHRCE